MPLIIFAHHKSTLLFSQIAKKLLQDGLRLAFADALIDLRRVEAGRRVKKAPIMGDRTRLEIGSAIIKPPDAGERNRRRAHRAGFQRDIKVALGQPRHFQRRKASFEGEHFGMSGRVFEMAHLVSGLSDDAAAHALDEAGTDRHFIKCGGLLSLFQRDVHKRVLHIGHLMR